MFARKYIPPFFKCIERVASTACRTVTPHLGTTANRMPPIMALAIFVCRFINLLDFNAKAYAAGVNTKDEGFQLRLRQMSVYTRFPDISFMRTEAETKQSEVERKWHPKWSQPAETEGVSSRAGELSGPLVNIRTCEAVCTANLSLRSC